MTPKELVLLGGGHAHMTVLAHLADLQQAGSRVTVIQPSAHHYYSGMGPGMLGGSYTPEQIRFPTKRQVEEQGGTFILDRAVRIDPEAQLIHLQQADRPLGYDLLSCNVGSQVRSDAIRPDNTSLFTVKPIETLVAARSRILSQGRERPLSIAVLGGGPSAVEIAGNLWRLGDSGAILPPTITLISGKHFLARLPSRVRTLALNSLKRRQITIRSGHYVQQVAGRTIILDNQDTLQADIIFSAIGIQPSPLFRDSSLAVGPEGGLRVNRFLQSVDHTNIFAGGDCIFYQEQPLDKVGVYAVRQNPVLLHNLLASLRGEPLQAFTPGGSYLLIYNLGDERGIFSKWSLVFGGRLAFALKDWIDRRFMASFQPSRQDS
ncbi:NAD(P)/FAD-dependent oxidoreductase [Desulfogranum mediterraneum]|uniref:NAD(P)/FAD-dependent oxidoreductase n=1 Tax=Desulfogranum mediterraneum TaxID=160661 RepID=UPI0005566190|nr:FAD-dependent oxidoreductase [Desulfogranum mediterraneum]